MTIDIAQVDELSLWWGQLIQTSFKCLTTGVEFVESMLGDIRDPDSVIPDEVAARVAATLARPGPAPRR